MLKISSGTLSLLLMIVKSTDQGPQDDSAGKSVCCAILMTWVWFLETHMVEAENWLCYCA